MCNDADNHKLVSGWLGVSKRVQSVTAVSSEYGLNQYLSHAGCQLCILVVDDQDKPLPKCTLAFPQLRVLVITTSNRCSQPDLFYQQGATDVVTLHEPTAAQHAISRLIDECMMQLKLAQAHTQNNALLQENKTLREKLKSDTQVRSMKASNDQLHDLNNTPSTLFSNMNTPIIENIMAKTDLRDNATGLPSRDTVLDRFRKMLLSDVKAPRFTAMLVSIFNEHDTKTNNESGRKRGTRTNRVASDAQGKRLRSQTNVQDLTLHRAADALQKCIAQSTIYGRIGQNALLLIQPSDVEPVPRDAANRVRQSLGSLGGLIDGQNDVHINTMNLPSTTTFSADEVVQQLETLAD